MEHLKQVKEAGVKNIEMECTAISSLCYHTSVKCAVVCVALLNRLKGGPGELDITPEVYQSWQLRPQQLVVKFIKSELHEQEFSEKRLRV